MGESGVDLKHEFAVRWPVEYERLVILPPDDVTLRAKSIWIGFQEGYKLGAGKR